MRDNDNLSNSIAHNRQRDTTNARLITVQRMAELSKTKMGAENFVATVNKGEKSRIAKEFLPIYDI